MSEPPRPRESPAPRPPLAAYAGAWAALATVYAALYAANGIADLHGASAARSPPCCPTRSSVSCRCAWRGAGRGPSRTGGGWRSRALVPAVLALAVASTAGWLLLIAARRPDRARARARWPTRDHRRLADRHQHADPRARSSGSATRGTRREALREARERAARADVLRARAELQLLRSQLHPHFVLNVLHALLGLVRRDPARAEAALERLGELLRFGQWVQQTRQPTGCRSRASGAS